MLSRSISSAAVIKSSQQRHFFSACLNSALRYAVQGGKTCRSVSLAKKHQEVPDPIKDKKPEPI